MVSDVMEFLMENAGKFYSPTDISKVLDISADLALARLERLFRKGLLYKTFSVNEPIYSVFNYPEYLS